MPIEWKKKLKDIALLASGPGGRASYELGEKIAKKRKAKRTAARLSEILKKKKEATARPPAAQGPSEDAFQQAIDLANKRKE
jgi:hypothetical protein